MNAPLPTVNGEPNIFGNYIAVINDFDFRYQGPNQWGAFLTTIVYSFASTILTMTLGLIAALLLNHKFVGRGIARAVFLFPYVAPVVSVAFGMALDSRPATQWRSQRYIAEPRCH
jgi:multiple sugar transport system permease protein